ncbi:MAG: alpha/beta fold hydrolase [Acidobacteriota bacterium]
MGIEFFRFRRGAEASADTPAIVLLHGGPGFEGLGPRLEEQGYFTARLSRYTRIADVIVPGQRGFGTSGAVPCDPLRALTVNQALDAETRHQNARDATAHCREKWRSQGVDLTGLNVVEAAADVADIVRLLGYEKVQLRGVSFGSHWGMAILRYHPDVVERATLASLEGPDHTYDRPSGVLAAMERIASSAEASSELRSRLPDDGLLQAYGRLIARADTEPISVEIEHPVTGDPVTIDLDGDDLRQIFAGSRRFTQFRFRTAIWPLALLEILEGDLRHAAGTHVWNLLDTELDTAAHFQYDCGSGVSQARSDQIRNDPAAAMLGPIWQEDDTWCEGWDADLGEDFRSPFRTSVPTVLVQGNWDTGTPYENAVELRTYFENHHFVHVEGGSHGALREAIEEVEGFQDAMDHWLTTGELEQIPESVELPPFQWNTSF